MADLKTVVEQKNLCGLSASDKNELAGLQFTPP